MLEFVKYISRCHAQRHATKESIPFSFELDQGDWLLKWSYTTTFNFQ